MAQALLMANIRLLIKSLLITSLVAASYAFLPPPTSTRQHVSFTALAARRGKKPSKGRGKQAAVVSEPPPTKSSSNTLPSSTVTTPVRIAEDCTVHVAQIPCDDPWWDETLNANPFGAKVWPVALGIAQYIWQQKDSLKDKKVLEVGCGTGLVAQVAALAGATVEATDVSPVALKLTRQGWKSTAAVVPGKVSLLTASIYDVFNPLPEEEYDLLIATCVLYEGELGVMMAKRIVEAYERGMWIILGDDDTGFREGGRQCFLDQLESVGTNVPLEWKHGAVRCQELGWREKSFSYLEMNAPQPSIENGEVD